MDEIKSLALLISSGLIIRYSLTMTGQAWAKSHAQTVAFMILPVITYVITKTIAGNIALSLGMVGDGGTAHKPEWGASHSPVLR